MSETDLPAPELLLAEFRSRAMGSSVIALRRLVERLRRANAPASTWEWLAGGLLAGGDVANADALLKHGLLAHPGEPGLHYLMGNALRVQGKLDAAEDELRGVLAARPEHTDAVSSLAFLLRERGRMGDAAAVMGGGWQPGCGGPDEARRIATFLAQCDRHVEALEVCTRALAIHPNADLFALSGTLAMTLGQFKRAASDLRNAVEINPKLPAAWLWLALTRRFTTRDDPDLVALEALAATEPIGSNLRISAGFALGKAYDDLGDIPAAVSVLRDANAAMAARAGWQVEKWDEFVERQVAAKLPESVANGEIMPVFVVGLPRTGTTLIASVLGTHPQVRNRGELGWLGALAEQGAPQGYPKGFLARGAGLYAAQLRQDDAPAHWYIDKNPFNFRYLGLAAALFSSARVIHCRRDPRDCALSTWRQYFANTELGYAYRFSNMASVARGHDRLMAHWRANLSLPIFDLEYERLVSHPDETVAALLRFLELDAESGAHGMNGGQQAICTSSVWQARQPIFASSVGRWRAYAEYLPELVDTFSDLRVA